MDHSYGFSQAPVDVGVLRLADLAPFHDVCHCCMSTPDISWREVTDFMRATSVWSS